MERTMRIAYAFKCVRYTISNVYTFVLAPREIVKCHADL